MKGYTLYHTVCCDGTSKWSNSFTPSSGNNILFYVKETVNEHWSYGNLSDFEIIDNNGNITFAEINGYKLCSFSTQGTAESYILVLCTETEKYTLTTDARFNLPLPYIYHYQEWEPRDNIFKSIIKYFEELRKYGYETLQYIISLRRENHNKANKISSNEMRLKSEQRKIKQLQNAIINVVIPDELCDICEDCFKNSQTIKRVILHRNVRYIGSSAFYGCQNLSEIFCMAIEPPRLLGSCVFSGISKSAKIFVPKIAVNKYKSENSWKPYAEMITEYEY